MEFDSLDRCAAYVAARSSLDSVHRAAFNWPAELADQARRAAVETVVATAEALGHDPSSPARRRCLRCALATAIELAATCDVIHALGLASTDLDESLRHAGRTVSLLGMFFHATASGPRDDY